MKKLLPWALALALVLCSAGCTADQGASSQPDASQSSLPSPQEDQ